MRLHFRRGVPIVITAAWGAAVVAGLSLMWGYGAMPGKNGHPRARWPESTLVRPVTGRANLVMAVHPRCPCTRASIAELARLMARCKGSVEAHVLFLAPASMQKGWERSDLWSSASLIPGVHPITDAAGSESARFGLETSGHVSLYDAAGNLGFTGGITDTRGHEGDNAGLDEVVNTLNGHATRTADYPVFGCPIF
ncbi:MAG: hypothetical protein P4L84_11510 [Isosphaeraceae bacterium]|nr:hypothetical protein [Isosphaeraceae bacterium]